MIVQVHGFDWTVYAERVMPAFANWLIDKDESPIYSLFEQTRCALEERFLPEPMQHLRVWPRAKAFVDALPRGPHSRKEYTRLCSAEQFTLLSDHYLHQHAPHLYSDSSALRTIWSAVIEEYCLPWFHTVGEEFSGGQAIHEVEGDVPTVRSELVSLLQAAGLADLAQEVGEQVAEVERIEWESGEETAPGVVEKAAGVEMGTGVHVFNDAGASTPGQKKEDFDLYADEENVDTARPKGIIIGPQLNILRLRGWLAGNSLQAMALFEYLACGRRSMPFGFEPGEPYGAYRGYLTLDETWQLAALLHNAQPPSQAEAEEDYSSYRGRQMNTSRLIDEVLPTNAHELLKAVRRAARHRTGLICSID